jgi:hypothetical protein
MNEDTPQGERLTQLIAAVGHGLPEPDPVRLAQIETRLLARLPDRRLERLRRRGHRRWWVLCLWAAAASAAVWWGGATWWPWDSGPPSALQSRIPLTDTARKEHLQSPQTGGVAPDETTPQDTADGHPSPIIFRK